MEVEVVLRKFGNSTGLALPPGVLKNLGLRAGQSLTLSTTGEGALVLKQKSGQRYSLSQLIAQCNPKAPPPADMVLWDNARPVGREAF